MRKCDMCEKEINEDEAVIVGKDKRVAHIACWFDFHNKTMRERSKDPRVVGFPDRNQQPI